MSAHTLMPRCSHPFCTDGFAGEEDSPGQPAALGSKFCYWHDKLMNPRLGVANGADSRRGPGNHSPNPRQRYDYGTWLDGRVHTLTRSVDFAPDLKTMRNMLYKAARRLSCAITIELVSGEHDTITVQATPKSEAGAA